MKITKEILSENKTFPEIYKEYLMMADVHHLGKLFISRKYWFSELYARFNIEVREFTGIKNVSLKYYKITDEKCEKFEPVNYYHLTNLNINSALANDWELVNISGPGVDNIFV